MSEKTLQFNDIILNKKEKSKEPIHLLSVEADQIVASHKFKLTDDVLKYFIGYNEDCYTNMYYFTSNEWYIKHFKNGSKNVSFLMKDDEVWDKYDEIWYVFKDKLGIKFHSKPVYTRKYLKVKVREFDGVIKINFLGNDMPKENMRYTCIACITIDSVLRMD